MPTRKKPGRPKAKGARVGRGARPLAKSRPRGRKAQGSATEQALADLTSFLDASGAPASIIGGIAVNEKRVARLLREFDSLLDLDREGEWRRLLERLKQP